MFNIQFIECIALSLYGLLVAVRLKKNKSLYEKMMVIILLLCQIHIIIALLDGKVVKGYITEILFVIVITAMCIYNRTSDVKIKAAFSFIFRICGLAVYIAGFVYLVHSVNIVQKYMDIIASSQENIYVIKSAVDEDMVITADIQDGAEGSHLYYAHYTGSNNQKFELLSTSGNQYKILIAGMTQAFDLSNGDMNEGTQVNSWEMYDTPTQLWELEDEGGCFTITSVHSGLTIANREPRDSNICVYRKDEMPYEKYILSRTVSDQQVTQMVAGYSDRRIFNVSVYYAYVIIMCMATVATVIYSIKRNNREKNI